MRAIRVRQCASVPKYWSATTAQVPASVVGPFSRVKMVEEVMGIIT